MPRRRVRLTLSSGKVRSGLASIMAHEPGSGFYRLAFSSRLRQATCYTEAGKPAQGASLFADVLATGKLSRRDAGFFGARRAAALALSGEPDEAAQVGLEAVGIAKETHSERTTRLLGDVVRSLTPWSSRPGPRALREALSALSSVTSSR